MRGRPALAAAAFLVLTPSAAGADARRCPHAVVTKTGEKILTLDAVRASGPRVTFRLCSSGTLTAFAAADIDWEATEKADAAMVAAPTPGSSTGPTPKPSLSTIAKEKKLRSEEELMRLQEDRGTMKVGASKSFAIDNDAPFFGKESVAEHLSIESLGAFVADCPYDRARVHAEIMNRSRLKIRNLRAAVLIGNIRTGAKNEQIQTTDPENILPGERASIDLYLSCDSLAHGPRGSRQWSSNDIIVLLRDVAGRAEPLARPDPSKPFTFPTPKLAK